MEKDGVLLPLVFTVLGAGCVLTVMGEGVEHWIPILLALGTVSWLASSRGR
jgi:hypothetical protein